MSTQKSGLEQAADVIDSIADVGAAVGQSLGGVAGTVTSVVSIGAGLIAAILRCAQPVVQITRMRDAVRAAHAVDGDVDELLRAMGVP